MAYINRGDDGERREVRVQVRRTDAEEPLVGEIQVVCGPPKKESGKEWGFDVIITLTRDEALGLCADLALRLKTLPPPESPPLSLGTPLL